MSPDGGAAFPRGEAGPMRSHNDGMTLRDWFAGQALAGLLANNCAPDYSRGQCNAAAAERAFAVADFMLRAREKEAS